MATYSKAFAHIGRAKRAEYRARVKARQTGEPQVVQTPEAIDPPTPVQKLAPQKG